MMNRRQRVCAFTVTALVATLGVSLGSATYAAPPRDGATLQWLKTMSQTTADPFDTVTVSLSARNTGNVVARDVVATDPLPPGMKFLDGDAGCSASGTVVTCQFPDLAPDNRPVPVTEGVTKRFRVKVQATGYKDSNQHQHQLTIGKVERYVSLAAGEERTEILNCADDQIATDGTSDILGVDQGTGTSSDVTVVEQYPFKESGYRYVLRNNATGQAQAKLFVVCLNRDTTAAGPQSLSHSLTSELLGTGGIDFPAGTHTINTATCRGGTPIAPGYRLLGNVANPAPNGELRSVERIGDHFRLTVRIDGPASSIEAHTGCLANRTELRYGHRHDLRFTTQSRTVRVPAHSTVQESVICPDGSKGITSGYLPRFGVTHDGNEPQPKSRVFRLRNTTNYPDDARIDLLCLAERTGNAVQTLKNTATITTSTPYQFGGPSPSTALIDVLPAAAPVSTPVSTPKPKAAKLRNGKIKVALACRGDATCAGKVIVKARGKRLGAKKYAVKAGKRNGVPVRVGKAKLNRAKSAKFVKVKVKQRGVRGATTRVLRLR